MSQQIDSIAVTNTRSLGPGRAHGWETPPQLLPGSGVRPHVSPPTLTESRSMNSTAPQLTDVARQSALPRPTGQPMRGSVPRDHPTWGDVFAETVPLIGAPAFFGPPVSLLLGPWLLLVLLLVGPFALILTIVLAMAAVACLLAMFVAVIASPYLLIRHLRAGDRVRTKPRAARHLLPKHRVGSRRLALQQPKGLS